MRYVIFYNTVVTTGVLVYLIIKNSPICVEVKRTVWCKKAIGIEVWLQRTTYSATRILYIPLRNSEKMDKWDSEQLKNGNYKNYIKDKG